MSQIKELGCNSLIQTTTEYMPIFLKVFIKKTFATFGFHGNPSRVSSWLHQKLPGSCMEEVAVHAWASCVKADNSLGKAPA